MNRCFSVIQMNLMFNIFRVIINTNMITNLTINIILSNLGTEKSKPGFTDLRLKFRAKT